MSALFFAFWNEIALFRGISITCNLLSHNSDNLTFNLPYSHLQVSIVKQVEQGAPGLPVISHPLGIVRLSNFLLQAFVRLGGKFRNKFKNLPLIVVVSCRHIDKWNEIIIDNNDGN